MHRIQTWQVPARNGNPQSPRPRARLSKESLKAAGSDVSSPTGEDTQPSAASAGGENPSVRDSAAARDPNRMSVLSGSARSNQISGAI